MVRFTSSQGGPFQTVTDNLRIPPQTDHRRRSMPIILHGTLVTVTREGMREVLEGIRDPRDGDEEESVTAISEASPKRPS